MSESIDHSWTCREDSGIERNQSSKKTTVTHNSVFAAHRLQCRMTIHKIDIRHFVFPFCHSERSRGISDLFSPVGSRPRRVWISKYRRRCSSLFGVVQIYPCLDIIAIIEPSFVLRCRQVFASRIAPAAFQDERIPNLYLLLSWPPATRKAPLENFLIRPAFQRSRNKVLVIYSEKSRATRVEVSRIFGNWRSHS